MKIRKASMADVDEVCRIYSKIHDEEEAGRAVIGWNREIYPKRETAAAAVKREDLFVMTDDEMVVASAIINQIQVPEYANCMWDFDAAGEEIMVLHTLTVDPGFERKGCGTAFVEFYESYAKDQGCTELRMDTNVKNARARALYKSLGYKEVGIVECVFNGIADVKLVCLEKRI